WVVDGLGWRRLFAPLVALGRNAIVIYFASEALAVLLDETGWHARIYDTVFRPLASPANASLLFSAVYLGLTGALAYVVRRRGWTVKVCCAGPPMPSARRREGSAPLQPAAAL